jgi:hypothetical protein
MVSGEWSDSNWDALIDVIQTGKCILMLGPAASTEDFEGGIKPLTEILANRLAYIDQMKELIHSRELTIDTSNLAQVALYYEMTKNQRVGPQVKEFYRERQGHTSTFHLDLAALPFQTAICSTPDHMFTNALNQSGKKPLREHYDYKGNKKELIAEGTVNAPQVYHLYGVIENPNSLVITENEVLDFIVKIASGNPPLPTNLLSKLRDQENHFLFLGFGFHHWYLRILLHILKIGSRRYSSFALEKFDTAQLKNTVYFFSQSDYKIQICNADLIHFARELRRRYELITPITPIMNSVTNPSNIFICHTSEDVEYAGHLYDQLKEIGFNPWVDVRELKGGTEWNPAILKKIDESDYFVILNSTALAKKDIGYVNREIGRALGRQEEFRDRTFIIPIRIDDAPLLDTIKQFQYMGNNGDPTQELLDIITLDQEKVTR